MSNIYYSRATNVKGFTLVELAVVILIVSLVVSMVALNYSSTIQKFREQRIFQQLLYIDQKARKICVSSGRHSQLVIEPKKRRFTIQYSNGSQIESLEVEMLESESLVVLTGKGEQHEETLVSFSPAGVCELYAIGLRSRSSRASRWVLFLGSGQSKIIDSQAELENWASAVD